MLWLYETHQCSEKAFNFQLNSDAININVQMSPLNVTKYFKRPGLLLLLCNACFPNDEYFGEATLFIT